MGLDDGQGVEVEGGQVAIPEAKVSVSVFSHDRSVFHVTIPVLESGKLSGNMLSTSAVCRTKGLTARVDVVGLIADGYTGIDAVEQLTREGSGMVGTRQRGRRKRNRHMHGGCRVLVALAVEVLQRRVEMEIA